MIKNEYMEEIIDCSKKDEFIKKGLINRVALSLVEQCDPLTKSSFEEFNFIENLWNDYSVIAECNREYGVIHYCYEHALYYAMETVKDNNSYLVGNLTMLEFLLHEFEHLKEKYKQQQNEIIDTLINTCSADFIMELVEDKYIPDVLKKYTNSRILESYLQKKYKKVYLPLWDVCPDEKIAESDASKILLDSVDSYPNFNTTNKEAYEQIVSNYLSSLLMGYKKNTENNKYSIPLKKYLNTIKKIDVQNKLDMSILNLLKEGHKYTTEERMKYGLPIREQDVEEVKQKILIRSTK